MADIRHWMRIHAPRERVYAALATQEGVSGWWTREAELDERVGGEAVVRFTHPNSRRIKRLRIDALEAPGRVVWTPVEADGPGDWVGATISFDLAEDGEDTIVRFAQTGFGGAEDELALVTTGWAWYLMSLKALVETGRGAPHPAKPFLIAAA